MKLPVWVRLCVVVVCGAAVLGAVAAVVVVVDRVGVLGERAAREELAGRFVGVGDGARAAGDLALAGRAYASALEVWPGDGSIQARLVGVHVDQVLDGSSRVTEGNAARLQLEFSERLVSVGRDARTLAALGRVLLVRGQLEGARARLQEAVALNGGLAVAHVGLAEVLVAAGEWTGAVASAERALAIEPEGGRGHLVMAQAQLGLGAVDGAAGHFAKAAVALDDPLVWQALGRVEAGRERWTEAEAAFARVLARRPDASGVFADYGRVLARLGRLQGAARFLERAYRETGDLDAYGGLGEVALRGGDFGLAVRVFGELAVARAGDAGVLCGLGSALEGAGEWARAVGAFERCAELAAGVAGQERLVERAGERVAALRGRVGAAGGAGGEARE